jgi:hypothetical protein
VRVPDVWRSCVHACACDEKLVIDRMVVQYLTRYSRNCTVLLSRLGVWGCRVLGVFRLING